MLVPYLVPMLDTSLEHRSVLEQELEFCWVHRSSLEQVLAPFLVPKLGSFLVHMSGQDLELEPCLGRM